MDWQTKIAAILSTGIIADTATETIFSPVIQLGALGVLMTLLWMNFKSGNADRKARADALLVEREMREKEDASQSDRIRYMFEATGKQLQTTIEALERAYSTRSKQ